MPLTPHASVPLSRRRFLALAGLVPALAAAPAWLWGGETTAQIPPVKPSPSRVPIGLELYAVRNELARDLPGTLQRVSEMGYEVVEFYAPYFEWTPQMAREVRARMDGLGLRCLSTHNHFEAFAPGAGLGKAIELNHILGARQVVLASAPREAAGREGWLRLCSQLSEAAGELRHHGLAAGYHNHQAEWKRLGAEERIMDIIAANTPDDFVLQLDVGTCLEAGQDPVAWIRAHPGRIRNVHLKDWAPGSEAEEKAYRVLFAEGVAPWREIVAAAEQVGGVEVFLMEQEGSRFSEMESAKRCLDAWRALRGRT